MTNISDEMHENLQQILEKQNGSSYTLEQTKEIGDGLIDFYRVLIDISNQQEQSN